MEIHTLEMEIKRFGHNLPKRYYYGIPQHTNQKEATMQILTPSFVKLAVAVFLITGGEITKVPFGKRAL